MTEASHIARLCRSGLCTVAFVLGGAPLAGSLSAQTAITLEGRVLDDNGAPIENAQIAVVERATGERRYVLTRRNGEFHLLALSPGTYAVTASAIGFHPRGQMAELVVGQRPMLRFDLQPSAIELEPIVVSAPPVSSTEIGRTSVSTVVLGEEIRHLPMSTRNAMDLAGLAPGIRSFRPLGGHSVPSAGALRGERFLNLYVDGVEMKNLYDGNVVGFPQTGSPLPADALKEFRIYLQPYDAAYARAAAYTIQAVTQRGTNETHGSIFGFLQHRDLVAANDFLRAVPNFTDADFERQQAGFSLRGPIVRNRLFYAASYELSDTRSYVAVVPGRPAFDPGFWDDHAGVFEAPHQNHTGLLRLTYAPNDAHTIEAIGSGRQLTNESRFGGLTSYESVVADRHSVTTINLRHRWLATQRLVNELSFQLVGWSNTALARNPRPFFVYPSLQIGSPAPRFEIDERHIRVVNRLTYAIDGWHGSHLMNAGVEIARVSIDNFFPNLSNGRFEFNSDTATLPVRARIGVGSAFPDSDRDAFSRASGWVSGIYLNHEWRPIPNLALNLGVRYDAELNLLNNDLTVPWIEDPELAAMPELERYLNRGDRKNDLDNISPRVSFSWDLFDDGRTFLRGGFGIIYDRIPSFIAFQERRDASWRAYDFDSPGTTDPAVLRQRVVSGEGRLASFTLIANDMEVPESRQWSVGVGRQVTPAVALNLDYVHQDVRNLFAELDLNWLDVSVTPAQRALSSRYGAIVVWDDFARARYRALLSQLTYQPNPELRVNLAYTLGSAKAEWDVANRSVPAGAADQFYVMQRTSGDERHRFVLSGLVPLPLRSRLSLIATIASPRPYLGIVGQDLNQNNFFFDDWIEGKRFLVPPNRWSNWYRVVDVRLAHSIPFQRGIRSSVIVEAFNVLNSKNYSEFQGRQKTPLGGDIANFQQPSGVFGTRQFQVGARVEF